MGNVNVTLPDGSVRSVPEEMADTLEASGDAYREDFASGATAEAKAYKDDKYSSGYHRAMTVVEGANAGWSAGLTDVVLGDEDTAARAEVNPGTRLVSELATAIPSMMVGSGAGAGAKIAGGVPGMFARAGEGVAGRLGGGVLAKAAGGAVEGALYSASTTATRAHLSGDPLTVESFLLSVGTDAVISGGVVGALSGAGKIAGAFGKKADDVVAASARSADEAAEIVTHNKRITDAKDLLTTRAGPVSDALAAVRETRGALAAANKAGVAASMADDAARIAATSDEIAGAAAQLSKTGPAQSALDAFHEARTAAMAPRAAAAVDYAQYASQLDNVEAKLAQAVASDSLNAADKVLVGRNLRKARSLSKGLKVGDGTKVSAAVEAKLAERYDLLHEYASLAKLDTGLAKLEGRAAAGGASFANLPTSAAAVAGMSPGQFKVFAEAMDKTTEGRALLQALGDSGADMGLASTGFAVRDATMWHEALAGAKATAAGKAPKAGKFVADAVGFDALPKDIDGLAKLSHPEYAKVVKALSELPNGQGQHAINKLAEAAHGMGLASSGDALADAMALHSSLREVKTLSKLAPKKAPAGAKVPKVPADNSIGGAVKDGAKAAIVGKMLSVVGMGAGGTFAGAVMAARSGLQTIISGKVTALAAKHVSRASKAVVKMTSAGSKLTPILATKGVQEYRRRGKEMMDQHARFAAGVADAAYNAVKDLEDVAGIEYTHAAAAAIRGPEQYINAKMAKDPGNARNMARSDWMPSEVQVRDHEVRMAVRRDPHATMDQFMSGVIDPVAAEMMWIAYPGYMSAMAVELGSRIDELEHLPLSVTSALSVAFRVPLEGLMEQKAVANMQGLYEVKPPKAMESGGGGGGQSSGRDSDKTQVQKLQGR